MASSAAQPRASSRANVQPDERPRISTANGSFRTERPEPRATGASAQSGTYYSATSHKRSASGHARPISRTAEERERRVETRRVEEREYEARIERTTRAASPDKPQRRGGYTDRRAEVPRARPTEARAKESGPETPLGMLPGCPSSEDHTDYPLSAMESPGHTPTAHDCTSRLEDIGSTPGIHCSASTTASTSGRSPTRAAGGDNCRGSFVRIYGL